MRECNQCGKCCVNYSDGGLSASASEIEYWTVFRPELVRFVGGGNIWMCPDTGKQLVLCPWLKQKPNQIKYSCEIYADRPSDCKYYPVTIEQMINDECEMLESHDLINLKQAQKTLDKMMADSRPAVE